MKLSNYLRKPATVNIAEALKLRDEGALILDVRGLPEWRRNHIPGAIHLPLNQIENRWEELPENRLIITFCTGGFVSSWAANVLIELGFEAVNMSGGLVKWRTEVGELVSGD